jgi:SAM-dependent methyltransferase
MGHAREGSRIWRLNLGAGSRGEPTFINVDLRQRPGIDVLADVRALPFRRRSVAEVQAIALLEHFADPYQVLDEIHRIITPQARVYFAVPALGTSSAHLDPDHHFLADLKLWQEILGGYYRSVQVRPLGVRYRSSKLLVALLHLLVRGLRMYDLAQAWVFLCRRPRRPERRYIPWWLEERYGSPPERAR